MITLRFGKIYMYHIYPTIMAGIPPILLFIIYSDCFNVLLFTNINVGGMSPR